MRLELLKTACYFADLDPSRLADIGRFVSEKSLPAGEVFLWEGDQTEALYFVITGLVKLFATSAEGREFIVRLAYGGDSCNDDALFGQGTSSLSAMTMSPAVLYQLRRQDMAEIQRQHPQVSSNIARVLAGRERYLVRLATELVFKNVTARLACLLLEREKMALEGQETRITHQEMAALIGTVRELVSRSLHELEAAGAISLEHNQIIIANRQRLKELGQI